MSQPPAKRPPISEDTVNRMLTVQAKEQDLKARELEIRQQELKAQAEFAHKMVDAQERDRSSERTHVGKLQVQRLVAAAVVLVLLLAFLSYALYLGNSTEVFEFAKLLASALVGAFGGYGYKATKDKQRQDPAED